MHLKQIEILGFKSFPNKTLIKFTEGVTAIVGPNGCGKTNVLDALRWVLGEQKPTMLRGGKMEEVIFNGTGELKPLGMSEVTLTVVNDRGVLATEYHEIQITRRLFRSGDSEYMINKVPCRLKDIIDLFADTGMGAHSYSVIQQHMIDAVISDKAEERRFLFEEAAGITKYKQRRKAALRKLEATENDFLRLKDVYAEIKTRVNSLYRQHKKAERYKHLTDAIKDWEIFIGSRRVKTLQREKRDLRATFDGLSDQKSGRQTSLDKAYAQLEVDRRELVGLERQLTEINGEIYSITETAHQTEREISVLNEKKANARHLIERNTTDLEALDKRADALKEQSRLAEEELARQKEEERKLGTALAEAQAMQTKADEQLLAGRLVKEDETKKLVELEGRLSSGMTEENNLREQQSELSATIADFERQIQENLPKQKAIVSEIEELRAQLNGKTTQRNQKDNRQTELVAEMEERVESGEELSLELSNLTASIEACQARRNLLEEMILQFEGYESGVVAAMEVKDRWPGVAGTVADMFVPVEGMETVLEAALGDVARYLICYDRSEAKRVIEYLKAESKGKAGILVPSSGTISPAVKRPEIDIPGVVGWLDKFVTTDEPLKPLKDSVLSRTLVFEAGTQTDAILERLPYGFSAVSTDGVLYGGNFVSGGSDDRFPLFRRKEKVAEQESMISEFQNKLEFAQEQKNQNTAKLGALRAESGQLNNELDSLGEEIDVLQGKLGECEFGSRSLSAEFERLQKEKQNLSMRLESIRDRQYSLGLDANQLASQKENLVRDMSQSGTRLEDLERAAAEAADRVSRSQVSLIEARSFAQQTESQISHIREISNDIRQTSDSKSEEIDQAQEDIVNSDETIERLEGLLRQSFEDRDSKTARQEKLREVQAELSERTSTQEEEAKRLRSEKDTVADELHKAEIRLTAIESEIVSLVENVREDHEIDLTVLEEPARPEEQIADEQIGEHVHELKERVKKIGAVNLLALEEYEVAAEREKFLNEQLTDLSTAKNDLKNTINKINHTARDLFNETFAKVQENFRQLFVELFKGGEAAISLVDPDDPLESDIDIIARPGGKKLLPITILSGGERALTSIALLFSLYLVKPSPFCILDEIDAPLDDANCHRFLTIIRNFSRRTQFIIITHNKITMQTSNNLYGVTMERPGVSKLVAVKFAEGTEDGNGSGDLIEIDKVEEEELSDELPASIQGRINPDVAVTPKDTEE